MWALSRASTCEWYLGVILCQCRPCLESQIKSLNINRFLFILTLTVSIMNIYQLFHFPTFLGFGKVTNITDISTFFSIAKTSESAFQIQQQQTSLAFKKVSGLQTHCIWFFFFFKNETPIELNRNISYFSFWTSTREKIIAVLLTKLADQYKYLPKKSKETKGKTQLMTTLQMKYNLTGEGSERKEEKALIDCFKIYFLCDLKHFL